MQYCTGRTKARDLFGVHPTQLRYCTKYNNELCMCNLKLFSLPNNFQVYHTTEFHQSNTIFYSFFFIIIIGLSIP
jgi:hypothetical protein